MASASPLRLLFAASRPCARRAASASALSSSLTTTTAARPTSCSSTTTTTTAAACSHFSTAAPRSQDAAVVAEQEPLPRWRMTPKAMTAPVRSRPAPPGPQFKVNEDPDKLDEVYRRLLGKGGDQMLRDDVKWLVVTHKSFDHGRQGFNDRLALLGRRIVELQTSLALLHVAPPPKLVEELAELRQRDPREPSAHPKLQGLPNVSEKTKTLVLTSARLAAVAHEYGLHRVVRWKPKQVNNLARSGMDAVLATTLYAVVGAVALQKGGEVANELVRTKILQPLRLI